MTKSQEQRMNEFIENRMLGHNGEITDVIKSYMEEAYQAAMKEAEALVEALEFYRNRKSYEYKEHSDGLEGRGDFPVMDDHGTKAFRALKKFKGE